MKELKAIVSKFVHLSASYMGRLAKDQLDKYLSSTISDGLDHIGMLYANEPQFNENENERAIQPYKRLFYTPKLSKQDKINSH
ncbi:hypothetical protein J2780_003572 [Chryseobacterium camelliae]|nr:hypothetical protein [Chryseobacterium camelliae]